MREKEYICPYCRSKDVASYSEKTNNNGIYFIIFRCYNCARFFDIRKELIQKYGDNFPVLPISTQNYFKEHIKFENMGKVPKANKDDLINLWIDLWEFLKEKINGKNTNRVDRV